MVYITQEWREYEGSKSKGVMLAKEELSAFGYNLYLAMRNTSAKTHPTISMYSTLFDVSDRKISMYISELKSKGYLYMQKLSKKGGGTLYNYYLGKNLVNAMINPSDSMKEIKAMCGNHKEYIKANR